MGSWCAIWAHNYESAPHTTCSFTVQCDSRDQVYSRGVSPLRSTLHTSNLKVTSQFGLNHIVTLILDFHQPNCVGCMTLHRCFMTFLFCGTKTCLAVNMEFLSKTYKIGYSGSNPTVRITFVVWICKPFSKLRTFSGQMNSGNTTGRIAEMEPKLEESAYGKSNTYSRGLRIKNCDSLFPCKSRNNFFSCLLQTNQRRVDATNARLPSDQNQRSMHLWVHVQMLE